MFFAIHLVYVSSAGPGPRRLIHDPALDVTAGAAVSWARGADFGSEAEVTVFDDGGGGDCLFSHERDAVSCPSAFAGMRWIDRRWETYSSSEYPGKLTAGPCLKLNGELWKGGQLGSVYE
jgi:hypothetical protein